MSSERYRSPVDGDIQELTRELLRLRTEAGIYSPEQIDEAEKKLELFIPRLTIITSPEDLLQLLEKSGVKTTKANGKVYLKNRNHRLLYYSIIRNISEGDAGTYYGRRRIGNRVIPLIGVYDQDQITLEHEINHFLDAMLDHLKDEEYYLQDQKKIVHLQKIFQKKKNILKRESALAYSVLVGTMTYVHVLNFARSLELLPDSESNIHTLLIGFFALIGLRYMHIKIKVDSGIDDLRAELKAEVDKYNNQPIEKSANALVGQVSNQIRFNV